MRDSTELPDLSLFAVQDRKPHEDYDPRRIERLSQRILAERMWWQGWTQRASSRQSLR